MNTRAFIAVLVGALVACVAFGLGFHYVYARSALEHTAEQEAKSQLREESRRLSVRLAAAHLASIQAFAAADQAAGRQDADDVFRSTPADFHAWVVDPQWHVVYQAGHGAPEAPDQLAWSGPVAPGGIAAEPVFGTVEIGGRELFAAAHPLADHDGYVVVEVDPAAVKVLPATLSWHLLAATGITLLWISGLMAVSVYMIVTYFHEGLNRRREPDVDALKQTQALVRTQETVIFALAKLSDSRDPDTGDHLERISYYSSTLAAALRQHSEFRDVVTPSLVRLIGISSALHDIGKVGVEDAILKKPGSLTTAERSRMQLHTRVGEDCLKEIERRLGTSNFLQMAREIASAHHERWDGTGYPLGLSGEQIPIAARIVAIADVYDALSSKRVYKDALPHEECVRLIVQEAGQHFDPRLVEVFSQIEPSFRLISRQFRDRHPEHDAESEDHAADASAPDQAYSHAGSPD